MPARGSWPSATSHADQREGERARLDSAQIDGHEAEAGPADGSEHLAAQRLGDRAGRSSAASSSRATSSWWRTRRSAKPNRAKRLLRLLDLTQLLRGHAVVVRDPRRQAGCGRLVGHGQAEFPGHRADVGLVQSGRGQRAQYGMVGRGPGPRSIWAGARRRRSPRTRSRPDRAGRPRRRRSGGRARPCSGSSGRDHWRGTPAGHPRRWGPRPPGRRSRRRPRARPCARWPPGSARRPAGRSPVRAP